MPIRFALKRLRLLWTFTKMIPGARILELEIQDAFQRLHNENFANDLTHGKRELEVAKIEGYCKGIEWCLKRFS